MAGGDFVEVHSACGPFLPAYFGGIEAVEDGGHGTGGFEEENAAGVGLGVVGVGEIALDAPGVMDVGLVGPFAEFCAQLDGAVFDAIEDCAGAEPDEV